MEFKPGDIALYDKQYRVRIISKEEATASRPDDELDDRKGTWFKFLEGHWNKDLGFISVNLTPYLRECGSCYKMGHVPSNDYVCEDCRASM